MKRDSHFRAAVVTLAFVSAGAIVGCGSANGTGEPSQKDSAPVTKGVPGSTGEVTGSGSGGAPASGGVGVAGSGSGSSGPASGDGGVVTGSGSGTSGGGVVTGSGSGSGGGGVDCCPESWTEGADGDCCPPAGYGAPCFKRDPKTCPPPATTCGNASCASDEICCDGVPFSKPTCVAGKECPI